MKMKIKRETSEDKKNKVRKVLIIRILKPK